MHFHFSEEQPNLNLTFMEDIRRMLLVEYTSRSRNIIEQKLIISNMKTTGLGDRVYADKILSAEKIKDYIIQVGKNINDSFMQKGRKFKLYYAFQK